MVVVGQKDGRDATAFGRQAGEAGGRAGRAAARRPSELSPPVHRTPSAGHIFKD